MPRKSTKVVAKEIEDDSTDATTVAVTDSVTDSVTGAITEVTDATPYDGVEDVEANEYNDNPDGTIDLDDTNDVDNANDCDSNSGESVEADEEVQKKVRIKKTSTKPETKSSLKVTKKSTILKVSKKTVSDEVEHSDVDDNNAPNTNVDNKDFEPLKKGGRGKKTVNRTSNRVQPKQSTKGANEGRVRMIKVSRPIETPQQDSDDNNNNNNNTNNNENDDDYAKCYDDNEGSNDHQRDTKYRDDGQRQRPKSVLRFGYQDVLDASSNVPLGKVDTETILKYLIAKTHSDGPTRRALCGVFKNTLTGMVGETNLPLLTVGGRLNNPRDNQRDNPRDNQRDNPRDNLRDNQRTPRRDNRDHNGENRNRDRSQYRRSGSKSAPRTFD